MSQVNPIPKGNGISDEEEITAGRTDRGMDRDPLRIGLGLRQCRTPLLPLLLNAFL